MSRFPGSVVACLIVGAAMSAAAPVRADDVVRLEMKDGAVTPNPLEVPARKAFKLEIRNTGKTAAEFESKDLRKEKVIAPGRSAVIDFRPLDAGEYSYFDEYHEDMTKTAKIVAK